MSNSLRPRSTARQASLSITNSRSWPKPMSTESVMPSSHLILCRPLSSCPQSFPALGSFQVSELFVSSGQSFGVSASALVLPMYAAKSLQSCPTLCDPIDGSRTGSPLRGTLKARTLEWVAISFSNAWKWKVKSESEIEFAQSCPTLSGPMFTWVYFELSILFHWSSLYSYANITNVWATVIF